MSNKVISLNDKGSKYSIISALQEHIEKIEDLVVIIEWKKGHKETSVQLCNTPMSTADLAWFSAYFNGKIYQDVFIKSEDR